MKTCLQKQAGSKKLWEWVICNLWTVHIHNIILSHNGNCSPSDQAFCFNMKSAQLQTVLSSLVTVHLFWSIFVATFMFYFHYKDVLFGFYDVSISKQKRFYIINLSIILAKFHIHKRKFCNRKPLFKICMNEMQQYLETIQHSTNSKAIKTLKICKQFNGLSCWTLLFIYLFILFLFLFS